MKHCGVRRGPEPDRVLATVLFTDIVDDRGLHTLKGVPGEAHLFAVDRAGTAVA
jgi:hypothetical protein